MYRSWWQRARDRGRGVWWPVHYRIGMSSWWSFRGQQYRFKERMSLYVRAYYDTNRRTWPEMSRRAALLDAWKLARKVTHSCGADGDM